jgi:hypothetical protein
MFAMLSFQCKISREWEASAYLRDIGLRASTCDPHINMMTVWSPEVYPHHVDNPIVELNDIPRARAPGDAVRRKVGVERSPEIDVPDPVNEAL